MITYIIISYLSAILYFYIAYKINKPTIKDIMEAEIGDWGLEIIAFLVFPIVAIPVWFCLICVGIVLGLRYLVLLVLSKMSVSQDYRWNKLVKTTQEQEI